MKVEEEAQILSEYEEQKKLVALAEKRISELRDKIITQIGSGQHAEFIVLVKEEERESFSLKDAKAVVHETIWVEISKFVKKTTFKKVMVERL